jgi:hypothetical protein
VSADNPLAGLKFRMIEVDGILLDRDQYGRLPRDEEADDDDEFVAWVNFCPGKGCTGRIFRNRPCQDKHILAVRGGEMILLVLRQPDREPWDEPPPPPDDMSEDQRRRYDRRRRLRNEALQREALYLAWWDEHVEPLPQVFL